MSAITEPGLRERKRLATRRAIQVAALDLVAENGIDGTTVDEIARRADVSPRTFFNYFPSKEAAVVGDHPALPGHDVVEAFVAAGPAEPVMTGLARLIASALEDDAHDQDLMRRRKAVMIDNPQLFAMRMANMRRLEEELAEVVRRRLLADTPTLSERTASSRARLSALVAFAAMRHAWARWAAGESNADLVDHVQSSFAELSDILA